MKVSGFCGGAMAVELFCEYIVIAVRCNPKESWQRGNVALLEELVEGWPRRGA